MNAIQCKNRLISISMKKELSSADAQIVSDCFDFAADNKLEDCIFIIKNRIWKMPIAF